MKDCQTIAIRTILLILLMCVCLPSYSYGLDVEQSDVITQWEINWIEDNTNSLADIKSSSSAGWIQVDSHKSMPMRPQGVSSAWIKFTLPELQSNSLALYISEIYAQNMMIYLEEQLIYQIERNYMFDENRIFLPISIENSEKSIYMWVENLNDLDPRIGINKDIQIGNYNELLSIYAKTDLASIILGAAFVFIAIIMLICSIFLEKNQLVLCISLSLVIISMGILFITYPPYVFIFYEDYGAIFDKMFDIALLISIPALLLFFEKIFGPGYLSIITILRKFQILFSLFCILFMMINAMSSYQYNMPYYFASVTLFGIFMIIHLVVLCSISIHRTIKKNVEAIIFTGGFVLFTSAVVADLLMFYSFDSQSFFLWRWGAVCFIISLILLLTRNLASYQKQISSYSMKLEKFNYQLQRSEKMEIISELAASIAHEVRNPLQVTRGFLQLFAERADNKESEYMYLAIQELDRAANIITDFLTFAKPQIEDIVVLDVVEELRHIEGIIVPLANLQGGTIELELSTNLFIQGNSSKFKQAIINIIKNSIEALKKEGTIKIRAFRFQDEVIIEVQDNGEGMDSAGLSRLGEPYFSTKTKGTGLGLMVTFRIIEFMHGRIMFNSIKGEGTEVLVRFPYAQ